MGVATQIPIDTFDDIQLDAGILLSEFDPTTPSSVVNSDIISATSGGFQIDCKPTYSDMGSDVDNCPENTKELKHLDGWDITIKFTALRSKNNMFKLSLGAADIDMTTGKVTPRKDLKQTDFADSLWWIGDKADGGLVAVNAKNVLSTDGLSYKTSKNNKSTMSVTLTCHVSLYAQSEMPVDIYVIDGDSDAVSIALNKSLTTIEDGKTETLVATATPADATVTWTSSDTSVATVAAGVVTAVDPGTAVIVAKASKNDVESVAMCIVTVVEAEQEGEG